MAALKAVGAPDGKTPGQRLFDRIGSFLSAQRLDPEPANYAFAWHLFADPDGPLARAVEALTEGGVRLTRRDIDTLGCEAKPVTGGAAAIERAEGLVAQTQMQVEGFEDIVHAIRAETAGFGRDLAASAAAIGEVEVQVAGIDEVTRITSTMLDRVRTSEARLEAATREASELRKKLEEARDNARRDPLTNLPNRRAFEEAYAAESKAGEALCLAVCDVDHFKSVNDRFGHPVGDRVLKAIADALSHACGAHLVARYGGEEFAILFSGIEPDAALAILERARATVAAKRYRLRESDAPVGAITFSAGLVRAAPGESCQAAFQRADRLLYSAKEAGRNCVRLG